MKSPRNLFSDAAVKLLWLMLIATVIALISTYQIYLLLNSGSDYSAHLQFWEYTLLTGQLVTTHILFPVTAFAISGLMGVPVVSGGLIAGTLATVLTAIGVFLWLTSGSIRDRRYTGLCALVTLGLMIAYPINFLTLHEEIWLTGYISATIWHSSTQAVAKPLSLALWILVVRALRHSGRRSALLISLTLIVSLATVFAKPNFTLVLLPSVVLFALFRYLKKQPVDWRLLLIGFVLPSVIALAIQYALVFGASSQSEIAISPFFFLDYWIGGPPLLYVLMLLGSIAFPAVVYLVYWRRAYRSLMLNLAWVTFVIALIPYYLLIETGPRQLDGNWTWSAHAAMFILYVVSAKFALDHMIRRRHDPDAGERASRFRLRLGDWVVALVFSMSVLAGILQIGNPFP